MKARLATLVAALLVLCAAAGDGPGLADEEVPLDAAAARLVGRWSLDAAACTELVPEDRHGRRKVRQEAIGGQPAQAVPVSGMAWAHAVKMGYDNKGLTWLACELWLREDRSVCMLASFMPKRAPGVAPFLEGTWTLQGDQVVLAPRAPFSADDLPERITVDGERLRLDVARGVRKEFRTIFMHKRREAEFGSTGEEREIGPDGVGQYRTDDTWLLAPGEALLLMEGVALPGLEAAAGIGGGGGGGSRNRIELRWRVGAAFSGGEGPIADVHPAITDRLAAALARPGIHVASTETRQEGALTSTAWRLSAARRRALAVLTMQEGPDHVVAQLEYSESLLRSADGRTLPWILACLAAVLGLLVYLHYFRRPRADAATGSTA